MKKRDWSRPVMADDSRLNVEFLSSPFDLRHLTSRPTCRKYHPNFRCNCNGCWLARRERDSLNQPYLTDRIGMPSCAFQNTNCGGYGCGERAR